MRIFVPAASARLTDHEGHGEGLISWNILSRLAAKGHEIVACTRRAALTAPPPFELVETGPASRFESIEALAYAARVTKELRLHGGARSFSAALWLMPQGPQDLTWTAPGILPTIIGPLFPPWPKESRGKRRLGDNVCAILSPTISALHRRAMASATAVLLSTPAAAAAVPAAAADRTQLVPFGIDASHFKPEPLPATPTIGFVGRLDRVKGIHDLLEAFRRVQLQIPGCRLVIVGEGPEREAVERFAANAGGSVEVLGHVANTRVPSVLARTSVFCLPSHGEPFGMAILEAMAAGRSVVTTDAGGPRHLIDNGKGGALVASGDVAALASTLVALLRAPDNLEVMGRHNRRRIEEGLTWDHCVSAIERSLERATD